MAVHVATWEATHREEFVALLWSWWRRGHPLASGPQPAAAVGLAHGPADVLAEFEELARPGARPHTCPRRGRPGASGSPDRHDPPSPSGPRD